MKFLAVLKIIKKFQAIFASPDSYFTETRRWVLLVCVNTILRVLVLFT